MSDIPSLFEVCQTADELERFLRYWLKLDLPWDTVDPESTSSPLKFIWQVYKVMLKDIGEHTHILASSRNCMKCLAEGTLVATPKGPVKIEDIKIGDLVYDEYGKPVEVLGVWDQGEQEVVNLVNNRKVWATCTPKHIWSVAKGAGFIDRQVKDFNRNTKIKRLDLELPLGSVSEPYAYALGALLGDGCSTECGIRISSENDNIPNKVAKILGTVAKKLASENYSYIILDPRERSVKHSGKWAFSEFYEKNIRNKKAHEKTTDLVAIKTWDRFSLLNFIAGLIDTDGTVNVGKKFNTGQINIGFACQSESTVQAVEYAFMALWQAPVKIYKTTKGYKNSPLYKISLCHNFFCKKILKELTPFLVCERKKFKPEYETFRENNFRKDRVGFKVEPAGKRRCWDLTVNSKSSLYCLQNGLVTHNTLTSSTLQFLSMLHFRRDGVHIAATLDQSSQAILYLDGFMSIPELAPYQNKDNVKVKQFANLPPNSFTSKGDARLKVVTATKKGANSARASFLTFDEVDLTPQEILDEAAWIADPTRDKGYSPIFVYLSSRKANDGPVQNLLDKAEKENSGDEKVHKWSATDFMKKCEPEVHKPELGVHMAYVHSETLQTIWGKDKFESSIAETARSQWKEYKAFEGCKTCPAFIPCLGFSAKQRGDSKALRTIKFTSGVFKKISDPAVVISQGLNWKPEITALVFRSFSRYKHVQHPIDFYKWVTDGKRYNPLNLPDEELDALEQSNDFSELLSITPSKSKIYDAMVDAGWTMVGGTDFGYTDPAVTIVAGYHKRWRRVAILTLESETGFANHLWAEHVCKNLLNKFPVEFMGPDTADPASPSYFTKHDVPALDSKPSRIEPGVSFIRGMLWDPMTQSVNFAILEDSQMDNKNTMLIEAMEHWTHHKTPLGYDMSKFADNEWTHPIDALRYALHPFQEEFEIKANIKVGPPEINLEIAAAGGDPEAIKIIKEKSELMNQLSSHMAEQFGLNNIFAPAGDYSAETLHRDNNPYAPKEPDKPKKPKKSGGIKFKI